MKKILYPIFLALFTIMAFSCDNEPLEGEFGDPNGSGSGGGSFVATIDGNSFVADAPFAVGGQSNGISQLAINGINLSGNSIVIHIFSTGTGTYELSEVEDFNDHNGYGTYIQPSSQSFPYRTNTNSTGTLQITDYDTENLVVSGTFAFQAEREVENEDGSIDIETVSITEGEFTDVPLQIDGDGTGVGEDPLFEVELDGELFEGSEITDAVLNEDGLLISATQGNKLVGFQIYDPAVGVYDINADAEEGLVQYDADITDDESTVYISASGTLEITELDMANRIVSGTFSGTLQDLFMEEVDIEMTNGVFENISFSTDGPTNTGSAIIDGEDFNANVFPVVFVNGQIQVSLDNDLNEDIVIYFPEDIATGTYSVGDGSLVEDYSAAYNVEEGGTTTEYHSVPDSGEIVVESFQNDIVSGTFSFTVENDNGDTITITDGEFTVDVSF